MMYGRMPLYPQSCGGDCVKMKLFDEHRCCGCGNECQTVRICNPACPDEYADVELCLDSCGNLSVYVHRSRCCNEKPRRSGCCRKKRTEKKGACRMDNPSDRR